eukprot:UN11812
MIKFEKYDFSTFPGTKNNEFGHKIIPSVSR